MTQRGFPFDAGEGLAYELDWSQMAKRWLTSGIIDGELNELAVYGDSSGMQIKIPSGHAWVRGHYYTNDAEIIQAIAASNPTNPRIDRIVLRIDYAANTIRAVVLQGVAAGAPAAPALTLTDATYEFLLADIAVGAGVGLITAGNVTDQRVFARPMPTLVNIQGLLADRPAASKVPEGTLYATTDEATPTVYRSDGANWDVFATVAGAPAAGSITIALLADEVAWQRDWLGV